MSLLPIFLSILVFYTPSSQGLKPSQPQNYTAFYVCDLQAEMPTFGIASPGDLAYAKDSNAVYVWDGLTWNALAGGGGGAPTTATYITQTPDAGLSAEQAMSLLGTGLVKNTTGTGVQSIYAGSTCGAGTKATATDASGALTCSAVSLTADVSGDLPYASLQPATAANLLLGRGSAAGAGDWQEVTLGANLTMTGTVLAATGGGSSNVATVDLDFGSSGNTSATTVVTGQTWVTGTSKIICAPVLYSTSTRSEGADDATIEGLVVGAYARVVGTGFTVKGSIQHGEAFGVFTVNCVGS
jgi:hypothetical protein